MVSGSYTYIDCLYDQITNGSAMRGWVNFYRSINMASICSSFPIELAFPSGSDDIIRAAAQKNFSWAMIFPSIAVQKKFLCQLRQETGKPMRGLRRQQQFSKAWLSPDTVGPAFHSINFKNRPASNSYILFMKDDKEPSKETRDFANDKVKKPDQLKDLLTENRENGLNLFEYLVWRRDFVFRHIGEDNPFPDTENNVWLFDSLLVDGRIFVAGGQTDGRLKIWALPKDYGEHNRMAVRSAMYTHLI